MHASTALWSSALDRGENAAVVQTYSSGLCPEFLRGRAADIDPDEPVNMSSLLALECTQASAQRFCLKDLALKNM